MPVFFWLAAVTILHSDWRENLNISGSTLGEHGQCFIFEVPSLHKVAPRGCLHKVSPGSYPLLRGHVVTCLDPTAALHRVPATAGSVTVSGSDGDDVFACGTHNPKLQNLALMGHGCHTLEP